MLADTRAAQLPAASTVADADKPNRLAETRLTATLSAVLFARDPWLGRARLRLDRIGKS
jgi:hypothetical protein